MENVTGMVKGHMRQAYLIIIKTLRECGYEIKGEILNAMYFNVPQMRQRVIIIGTRKDLKIKPSHPRPQSKPIPLRNVIPSLSASRSQKINPFIDAKKPAATLMKTNAGYQGMPTFNDAYAKLWPRIPIGGNAANIIGKGQNSCVKVNPNRPSPTIPKMQTGRGFATICHPLEPRALTIDEAKIIGSFPDDFKFIGAYQEQWARIGNSVPPNLMKAIAEHIKNEILKKAKK
jgi:DNA (cytosine-5)-methyltransferase 1